MGKVILKMDNPLLVTDVKVDFPRKKQDIQEEHTALCRCGATKHDSFCDGTHHEINFSGKRLEEQPPFKERMQIFKGKKITIYYDKYMCCWSGRCNKALPEVFLPQSVDWIKPDAVDDVEKILAAVKSCPSGALSYEIAGKRYTEFFPENPGEIDIQIDGPYYFMGDVEVVDDQNSNEIRDCKDHFTICRCGKSKHMPYCDGSHFVTKFRG